jgi:glyoxylase-like metal-dependent hydrolase (beta-lactamase superfamily II)
MRDRATIFEDPTGLRILYDAGQSVTGANNPRLGKIDVVLLSHAHGDHIGDLKMKALEAGTCDGGAEFHDRRDRRREECHGAHGRAAGELHRTQGRVHPQQADDGMPSDRR